ncbi:MAG: hypothetical protein MJ007_02470 [Paludibacteraceae bacterium]|nr:hypothetical protein [Paludibacteraceae bacterium]
MKKYLIALAAIISAIIVIAQSQIWVYQSDGTRYSYDYSMFDSLSRVTPGTLALSQSERTIPYEGETFNLAIYASQPWKATVSDAKRVSLSKMQGDGNDDISVKVSVNKQSEKAYSTITFQLADGTKNSITLIAEEWEDKLTINPFSKPFTPVGGTFKMGISSNTDWKVSASEPWVTFDKTSGTLNDSIKITVGKGDTDAAIATITVTTTNGKTAHCIVYHEEDRVSVNPYSKTFPPAGGTYKIGVTSNTDWTVNASESWVTFDKTNGTLNDSIKVIVAKSDKVEPTKATITVTTSNGKTAKCRVTREGDRISVSPATKEIRFEGGSFDVSVTSNTEWTASSNKSWATLSIEQGTGDASIVINIASGIDKSKADTAIVTYTTSLGKSAALKIFRAGYTGKGDDVTDINGRSYPTVWIGGQNWMAENLKCDKYDTESETYNASWLTNNTIPTSKSATFTPYYTDASDKSKWSIESQEYGVNLTDAQVKKLGYLYNWAAAVGVADGYDYGTKPFSGNRQGICPNGWHIPSKAEWLTLQDYIEKTDGKGTDTAGKHLKTTSGWYQNGNGLDSYGFAALPAGNSSYGSSVIFIFVGIDTFFWTATPYESTKRYAQGWNLDYDDHSYIIDCDKLRGQSVRCLRN